jgi:O-antigen/teichoic acid export membrane protein
VVAALGLIGAGQLVLPLILGADYQETYPILAILSVASISIACGCANTVLQIETNAKFGLLINVVGLITLVVLSVAMTPFIGVLGAAAARAIAQTIVALAAFGRLGKMAGMASVGRDLSSAYLLAVAALTAFCITIGLLNPGPVARIIGAMLIGTVLCMAIRAIIKVPFATFAQLGSRMREPDTA